MMKSKQKSISIGIVLLVSILGGQQFQKPPIIEINGSANLNMPRRDYNNGWGFGINGVWHLTPRYGFNLAYSSTKVDAVTGNGSRTFASLLGGVEISFRRGDNIYGFTTIGLAKVSGEENTLFTFGIGLKIPIRDQIIIRIDLRDFFTEIGIPYFSYPASHAALQGLGESKFLELGLSVGYTFGKEKKVQPVGRL